MKLRISGAGLMAVGGLVGLIACSSSDPTGGSGNSAGAASAGAATAGSNSAGAPNAGAATSAGAGSGGAGAGGAPVSAGAGGALVSAGAGGVSGGASGSGGAPSAGGAPPASLGPFTCTEYIGAYLTMEWWNAGFENNGVDKNKWQEKWHHHGHILEWAKPDSPFWADTGDAMDDSKGAPIVSACTQNSNAPDRIVFLALSWEVLTEEGWVSALTQDIATIKLKRPSAKWIDLVTMVRCPMDMQCNPNANYGPGADAVAGRQDCEVYPYVDSAMAKVVAANSDFVGLGPRLEMAMCNPAHDGAHMTSAGNSQAAKDYAAYYVQHP